jgi:hypothetical protein
VQVGELGDAAKPRAAAPGEAANKAAAFPPIWEIRNGLDDLPPLSGNVGFDYEFDTGAGAIPLIIKDN